MSDTAALGEPKRSDRPRHPSVGALVLGALGLLAVVWIAPSVVARVADIDLATIDDPYAVIFGFVVFDALVPVFPSESLLNTGSNLAAQDGSSIEVWRLVVVGALGAVVGDSLLYWVSRTVLHRFMADRVETARKNPKVARSLGVIGGSAPALIVFGRFVPGLRFLVGATMGLTRHPYGHFFVWDVIGSVLWASYTCVFSYLVGSVIEGQPVLSILVSALVTTALLGALYTPLKRSWDETGSAAGP